MTLDLLIEKLEAIRNNVGGDTEVFCQVGPHPVKSYDIERIASRPKVERDGFLFMRSKVTIFVKD